MQQSNEQVRLEVTDSPKKFVPNSPSHDGFIDINDTQNIPLPFMVQNDLNIISKALADCNDGFILVLSKQNKRKVT